jgi:hypothetical protein
MDRICWQYQSKERKIPKDKLIVSIELKRIMLAKLKIPNKKRVTFKDSRTSTISKNVAKAVIIHSAFRK